MCGNYSSVLFVVDFYYSMLKKYIMSFVNCYWPRSSDVKHSLSVREVWASILGPVKSVTVSPKDATGAMFLRSCVAQALSRRDGSRHSLHVSL